jgi:hypothetical protein
MCQTDICYSWSPTVLLIKQKQIVCEGRLENGVFNGRLKIEEKREMNNAALFHPAHVTISSVAETIRQLIACCQRLRVGRTGCARLCARRCFVRASHAACTREVQRNLFFWMQDCQVETIQGLRTHTSQTRRTSQDLSHSTLNFT